MALEPLHSDVMDLVNMTGVTETEAIARLKGNNNNINQAANEFFDDPGSNRYRWDESEFNMDRDGNANDTAFNVYGPQEDSTQVGYHGNMPPPISRPPSRTNNQSPMSKIIDLTADNAGIMNTDQEDVELQRALHESAQEAGLAPQESGITTSNGEAVFGPATRSHYEAGKWELVPVVPPTKDNLLDAEPVDRKRDYGAPAFLRSNAQNHRLGALLTIYHEIPLARDIFLGPPDLPNDFHFGDKWWAGTEVKTEGTGEVVDTAAGFLNELRLLMAFLDRTDRAFGSVDKLTSLDPSQQNWQNPESGFFETWLAWNVNNPQARSVFSKGLQPRGFEGESEEEGFEDGDTQDFAILDSTLPSASDTEGAETLYDLADKLLWDRSGLELNTSAYIPLIADIISFRLTGNDSSAKIDIPPIWYPDRYLSSGREAALEMRKQKQLVREKLQEFSNIEHKLTLWQLENGRILKVQDLFTASLRHDEEPIQDESTDDEGETMENSTFKDIDLSVEIRKVMASIDQKLLALENERQKAREALRELSKLYTEPKAGEPPLHRYTLCGVSLTQTTTYVRRPAVPALIDMSLEQEEHDSPFQWWRISTTANSDQPFSVSKVNLDEVLHAAKEEAQNPILVYASDAALAHPVRPLPATLEKFVQIDNEAFKREFPDVIDGQSPEHVSSPGKRKYAASSSESSEVLQQRWPGSSIQVSQREVNGATELESNEPVWSGWNREKKSSDDGESAMLVDDQTPTAELPDTSIDVGASNGGSLNDGPQVQEMQERGGATGGLMGFRPVPTDGGLGEKMRLSDMDEVMSDIDAREESEAVKGVTATL